MELLQKNKFLREVEQAPKSSKNSVCLLWSVEQNSFDTRSFHTGKLAHRTSIEDVKKVILYLKLTQNFKLYNSMKILILLPTFVLMLLLYVILEILPKRSNGENKVALLVSVIIMYGFFVIFTWIIVRLCGSRTQDERYRKREEDFNKILLYFNQKMFFEKGVTISCGRYGSYLLLKTTELANFSKGGNTMSSTDDYMVRRATEFSRSMIKQDAAEDPKESQEEYSFADDESDELGNGKGREQLLKKINKILGKDLLEDEEEDITAPAQIIVDQQTSQKNKEKDTNDYVNEELTKLTTPLLSKQDEVFYDAVENNEPMLQLDMPSPTSQREKNEEPEDLEMKTVIEYTIGERKSTKEPVFLTPVSNIKLPQRLSSNAGQSQSGMTTERERKQEGETKIATTERTESEAAIVTRKSLDDEEGGPKKNDISPSKQVQDKQESESQQDDLLSMAEFKSVIATSKV